MRIATAFIITFLLCSSAAFSQQHSITGKVSDNETGLPLSYTNIRIAGTTSGTSANKEGNYELKLINGRYTLIASYIGYISDTVKINVSGDINNVNFKLRQSHVNLPEIVVLPGENPADNIIRKAIARKHERAGRLNSYEFEAYSKGIIKTEDEIKPTGNNVSLSVGSDSTKLKITGILENTSKGFFKKPDEYKEIIIARRQSSNFPSSVNTITGGRIIQNFYADDIQFFGRPLPGPLADNALDYYYFYIQNTLSFDNKTVFRIHMAPDNSSDPGFEGEIYITDSTFNLIKVDLQLNRAANTGGLFDTINVYQQFAPFTGGIYMPVDYRLFIKANVLGLARFGLEINSILYDYKINPKLNDDFFGKAILTVLPDADKKDSTYWTKAQTIPNTEEIKAAYKRIDSVSNASETFWDDFSPLSTSINFSKHFSTSAPLGMYHFNRVEGNTLDFGLNFRDLADHRLNSRLNFDYGFADKKFKKDFSATYRLGEYRTYRITFNAFDKLNVLFGESENYNELTSTVLALVSKYDFRDYYYSKGFNISASGEFFPVLSLRGAIINHTDRNAFKNTDFSFFARKKKFRENPLIYQTKINAVSAGFTFDFRNYIEDGLFRRRTSQGKSYVIFGGDITYSDNSFLNSDLNFTKYEMNIRGRLNTFNSADLNFRLYGIYTNGKVPYQNLYSLPGNINYTAMNNTFRTLNVNEIMGNRVVTFYLTHNFRDELFRMMRIPVLKDLELQFYTFFDAAISQVNNDSRSILPYPVKTFAHPFYEIGFGIGHVLFPMQFEFAWKLNYRDGNNFRFGINTFVL